MSPWIAKSLTLAAFVLALHPLASSAQQRSPMATVRPAATPERLQALVEQLSADEFLVRETAMLDLVAAGQAAIPAVSTVLGGASLEATSRGLHVLQQLGLSPDPATQDAARLALVEAASHKDSPAVARRAAGVLAQLLELRSAQALAELEKLGAKVVRSQSFNGVTVEEIIESIQVGPDFRGAAHDLRRLQWLTTMKLVLSGSKATDPWLKQAAAMTDIEELHLYQTAVTDAGLGAIAQHQSLRQVGVYYTPITDQGLAAIEKLPRLSFVKLYGTKVESQAAEKLRTATGLAKEKVDHRKGAFLGVGCLDTEEGCILSTVHEGSPAEKAGLLSDDVLVRFGETKIDSFATLTALIAQLDSGDVAEIEVQRQVEDDQGNIRSKKIAVKATLTPWEIDLAVENGGPRGR